MKSNAVNPIRILKAMSRLITLYLRPQSAFQAVDDLLDQCRKPQTPLVRSNSPEMASQPILVPLHRLPKQQQSKAVCVLRCSIRRTTKE